MLFFYNSGIRFFQIAAYLSAFFKSKSKLWLEGRRNWYEKYSKELKQNEKRIWMHCASVGEFEQGRNLLESLKSKYPDYKIVLTFFSPSGYELRKDYEYADYVFYLPVDTKANAKRFVDLVQPSLAVFVKYEFWYHYLQSLKEKNIKTIIISAAFRKSQPFFQWYGNFFRKMLSCFTMIFVQDEESKNLLLSIGISENVVIAGDTRYDRVLAIAENKKIVPLISSFLNQHPAIVAGSTWLEDEKILQESFPRLREHWKLIIAPHEIDKKRMEQVMGLFPDAVLYSTLNEQQAFSEKRVLIIDNIGMLSSLYAYGSIALVGGGFQKGGIHNVLEPSVFGLPVIIGPVYSKFVEAVLLVSKGYCFPVTNAHECCEILQKLSDDINFVRQVQCSLIDFVQSQKGATLSILETIEL